MPLSRYGLGTGVGYGLTRNLAMGNAGVVTPNQDHASLLNPALLTYTPKVNLEVDLYYTYRNLKVGNGYSYTGASGGPSNLSVSLPVHKRVTTAFGVRPHTHRDYIFYQTQTVGGDSIHYRSHGMGGTSQVFISTGVQVFQNISIGLEMGYVFGTLEDSLSFGTLPRSTNFTFVSINKKRVGQFVFKPGIHIRHPLAGKENTYLAFGATADLTGRYRYKNYQTFVVQGSGDAPDLLDDGTRLHINSPTTWSFGFGYYKSLAWSVAAEGDFINGNGVSNGEGGIAYQNGYALRLGGELSPGTKKSTRYFNVITFRAGMNYRQLPFLVEGKTLSEQSVSFGASFPIIRKEAKFSRPIINLAVVYGQRGNKETSVGLDTYWQISTGFILNDLLWFNRYRID